MADLSEAALSCSLATNREFGVADCVYVPALERFAANMPLGRGFNLRNNPNFPNLAAWYAAMDSRPAYQKIKSDDITHNLVFRSAAGLMSFGRAIGPLAA